MRAIVLESHGGPEVLQVREVFTSPMPPPLTLQRPHPNIEGLIAFRPVTAQAIAMLPGLRFLKVHRSFPQLGPAEPLRSGQ